MSVSAELLFNFVPTSREANSYSGLTRANTFFKQRPNVTNWDAATDDQKAVALMTATRAIDSFPGICTDKFVNYFGDQALVFPLNTVVAETGLDVSSATSTTLTSTDLADNSLYCDDFWNYGAVRITDGTGIYQVFEVSDFDGVNGIVTINGTWDTTPDTTSEFEIIAKIPNDIFYACCEIAYLYVPDSVTGVIDAGAERDELQRQGVKSFTVGSHSETFEMINGFMLPFTARQLLEKYTNGFFY